VTCCYGCDPRLPFRARDQATHDEACEHRPVLCNDCKQQVKRLHLQRHLATKCAASRECCCGTLIDPARAADHERAECRRFCKRGHLCRPCAGDGTSFRCDVCQRIRPAGHRLRCNDCDYHICPSCSAVQDAVCPRGCGGRYQLSAWEMHDRTCPVLAVDKPCVQCRGALHERKLEAHAAVDAPRAATRTCPHRPPGRFVPPESPVINVDVRSCDCCFAERRAYTVYTCKWHWLCVECIPRLCQEHHIDRGEFQCPFCASAPGQGTPPGELSKATVDDMETLGLLTLDTATRVRLHLERAAVKGGACCPSCKRFSRIRGQATVTCAHCDARFCSKCDVLLSHPLHKSCDAYRAARDKTGEQDAFLKREVKMCPRCNEGVCHYKNHGCHHIIPGTGCTGSNQSCGHHWCYQCGGTFRACACRACAAPGAKRLPVCKCPNMSCNPGCACKPCPDCKPGRPCRLS
jgi:hypothetical protein